MIEQNKKEESIYKKIFIEKVKNILKIRFPELSFESMQEIANATYIDFNNKFALYTNQAIENSINVLIANKTGINRKNIEKEKQHNSENQISVEKIISLAGDDIYHRPIYCKRCGDVLFFKSPGIYSCNTCFSTEYDDYGKVREFLYANPGATAEMIDDSIHVGLKAVRQMLREEKIERCGEKSFFDLTCLHCGTPIKSGKLCLVCMKKYNEKIEEKAKDALATRRKETMNIKGISSYNISDKGKIRYKDYK